MWKRDVNDENNYPNYMTIKSAYLTNVQNAWIKFTAIE